MRHCVWNTDADTYVDYSRGRSCMCVMCVMSLSVVSPGLDDDSTNADSSAGEDDVL